MIRTGIWLAGVVALLGVGRAPAADNTWTNAAANLAWSTFANNWSLGPFFWNNSFVDSAFFTTTGAGTITIGSPITLRGINFQSGAYTINGSGANILTLTSGGAGTLAVGEIQVASGLSPTINSPIAGTVGLTKTGLGTLTLAGTNTYTGTTTISAGTLRLVQSSGGTLSGIYSGAGNLALSGSNIGTTFVLSNTSNNYTGQTNVEFGTLQLGAAGVIPDASVVVLGSGVNPGVLRLSGFNETIGGLASSGSGASQVNNLGSAPGTNTLTINQAGDSTYGGLLGAGGGNNYAIVKSGAGTLTLSNGSNSYLGGTTINAGAISIGGDGNLGVNYGGLALNGGTLKFTGTGVVTALNANRVVSLGASGGTIDTSSLGAGGGNITTVASTINGTGPLTLNAHGDTSDSGGGSNSNLILTGANTFTGAVTINSGLVDIASNFGDAANAITINGGGLVATGSNTITRYIGMTGSGDRIVRVNNGAVLIISNGIGGGLGASGALRKTDSGTLILTGQSNFFGVTTIANGTLQLGNGNIGGTLGAVVDNSVYILNFNGSEVLSDVSGTGTVTLSGTGTLTAGGNNTYTGGTFVWAGTLGLGNSGTLPTGGNVSVLCTSGSDSFNLNNFNQTIGTLTLGGPVGGLNIISSVTTGTGVLTLGGDITYTSAATGGPGATISGNVNLGGSTRTIQITGSNTPNYGYDVAIGATIGGTGGLTLNGIAGGRLVLYGATSTYTGATTVSAGTLTVGSTNALPVATDLVVATNATLSLTGLSSALGVPGGTFNQTVGSLAGAGTVNLGSATLTILNTSSATNTTFSGVISNAGSFVKSGPGTQVLSGANTWTGTTTISGGTLQIGAAGTSGVLPGNVADNAALVFNRTNAVTYGGVVSGTGSLTQAGTGSTLTLTNSGNSYTGGTFVTAGTLKLGSASADQIPNGGNVTVSSGAVFDIGSPASSSNFATPAGTITLYGGTLRAEGSASFSSYLFNNLVMTGGTLDFTATTASQFLLYLNNGIATNASNTAAVWNGSTSAPGFSAIVNNTNGPLTINVAAGTTASGIDLDSSVSLFVASLGAAWIKAGPGVMRMTQQIYGSTNLIVAAGKFRVDDVSVLNRLTANGSNNSLTLNGGTLQYGGPTAASVANPLTLGANSGTIEVNTAATILTLANLISGPGSLTKAGPGTLNLANTANSYTGGTLVSQGTLSVAADGALGSGSGPVTVNPLGTLLFDNNVTTARTFTLFGGTLSTAVGATLTFNNATVGGGFLVGNFATTAGASTTFIGNTTTASITLALNGADSLTNFSQGGQLTVAAGQTVTMTRLTNQGSGSITIGAVGLANVADFQSYGTLTLNPAVVGSMTFTEVVNTGSSPMYFNGGSRTFLGTAATANSGGNPTFVAGIDLHGQNAVVAGGLFVNNGFVVDSSNNGLGTATIIADFGALVKGAGFFQNPIITQNGGRVQAGNSPGTASFGRFVFGPGGVSNYVFAIDDATGTAGPSPDALGHVSGWGLVKAIQQMIGSMATSGDFSWTATPSDKLTVAIDTLVNPTTVGTDVAGAMADFDPNRAYSWPAARWAGSYTGPTDAVTLNAATSFETSGFLNPVAGTFGWSLDPAGQTLSLVYTPSAVPEPGTLALIGAAAVGWRWRRRFFRVDV